MTKEEKIKEAYGKHYETVKNYIDDNGWCFLNVSQKEPINDFAHHGKTEWKPINGRVCWRPKSLQGIEDNNGWIRIESEDDLPISGDLYFCKLAPSAWDNEDYIYYLMKDFHKSVPHKLKRALEYTHYQPIEKPKPPIY